MYTSTSFIVLLVAVTVSQAIPAAKIENSLKETGGMERTTVNLGEEKTRAKKSAEFFPEAAPSGERKLRQISVQPQVQGCGCGCNAPQLHSVLFPMPPQVQPVHTLHILSPSQPCGQSSPTVNIVQPQTPAQPPQTLNIIQPGRPYSENLEIEEPEPEPEPEPEVVTEPTVLPDPEPLPEPIELEIVPVQEPCNEQMVVVPSNPLCLVQEVKQPVATVVEVPAQPSHQHVFSECSCRQRNSGAYRTAAETLRYVPSSGYRQVVPLTRTIRSEEEVKKE